MTRSRFVIGVCFIVLASATTGADQVSRLSQVMKNKMEHSQAILAAVVTGNWPLLVRESRALQALTREPAWGALNTPEHVVDSDPFVRSLQALIQAANQRDLDAAVTAQVALIRACVQCHKDMRSARSPR